MRAGGREPSPYRSSLGRSVLVGCEDSERAGRGTSLKQRNPAPASMMLPRGDSVATYTGGWGTEDSTMAFRVDNRDLQLLHVSREAQKLNQMINSWSKSPGFDSRPAGIATDLLRGALDLQESLLMLENLQKASGFLADTRRRRTNSWDSSDAEMGTLATDTMGFRRSENNGTAHSRKIPIDGSSRNRREELKRMIQIGLQRQNQVTIPFHEEKAHSGSSFKLPPRDGLGDGRVAQGHNKGASAAALPKKAKAPNLIARLMGLEEAPSEDVQPFLSSRPERIKEREILVQQSHFFDTEMPKASKPPWTEAKPVPERRALQEIIEAMQSKGLLRTEHSEETRARSPAEHLKWLPSTVEAPPIVIMKPVPSAGSKVEEAQRSDFMDAIPALLTREKGQISGAVKGEAAPRSILPVQAPTSTLPMQLENGFWRPVARDEVETHRKSDTLASSHLKQFKRESKRMGMQKPADMHRSVSDRARPESRSVRSMVTTSGTLDKATSSPPTRKPDSGKPVHAMSHVSEPASSSYSFECNSAKPATRRVAHERKIAGTTAAKEPSFYTQVVNPTSSKEENKEAIPVQEKAISEILSTALPSIDLPRETEQSTIVTQRDAAKEASIFHSEVMPKRTHGGGGKLHIAGVTLQDRGSVATASAGSTEELKVFLLCSPSFLLHAQELFDVQYRHQPVKYRRPEAKKWTALGGSKLLLDCSSELMASRRRRHELLNHPLSQSSLKRPAFKISVHRLVEDISEEMEKLRSYRISGDAVSSSLYERLGRDIMCQRSVGRGAWDWGWADATPVEEADRSVLDVEKLVLNELIEEAAMELVM